NSRKMRCTRHVSDSAEPIAACNTGMADVLLVSDAQLVPPMDQIDELLMQQTAVVLFFERPENWQPLPDVLHLPATVAMVELEERISSTVQSLTRPAAGATGEKLELDDVSTRCNGKIVSFWSAPGSPGRSTVALNYAVEAAQAG